LNDSFNQCFNGSLVIGCPIQGYSQMGTSQSTLNSNLGTDHSLTNTIGDLSNEMAIDGFPYALVSNNEYHQYNEMNGTNFDQMDNNFFSIHGG